MLFMIIEDMSRGGFDAVGERFQRSGRMLPGGVSYLSSWVDPQRKRCFQLMETEDPALLDAWVRAWDDLVNFEIIQVLPSAEFWRTRSDP